MIQLRKSMGRLRILFQLSRMNLSMSLITLIGLTIALSISSVCLIYLDSNKPTVYMSILENRHFKTDVTLYGNRHQIPPELFENYTEMLKIESSVNNYFDELNLNSFFLEKTYFPHYLTEEPLFYLIGVDLDTQLLEDCIEGSKLPSSRNETIIYCPNNTNKSLGDIFNITYSETISGLEYKINYTLEIAGIITPDTIMDNSPLFHIFPGYSFDILPIVGCTNIFPILTEIEKDLQLDIFERTASNRSVKIFTRIYFSYQLNTAILNHNNVVEILNAYHEFLQDSRNRFSIDGVELNNRDYHDQNEIIQEVITNFNNSFTLFLPLSVPVFILTLLLVRYSLNILGHRRQESITLCKMRALSSNFILIALIVETIIISFTATISGLLFGVVLFLFVAGTTGFLTFDLTQINPELVISASTIQTIFLLSLLFTFISQYRHLLTLSRASITTLKRVVNVKSKQKYRKFRGSGSLDIFLLIQGGIGIVVLNFLVRYGSEEVLLGTLGFLILILVVLCPLLLLTGIILTLNRFIPLFIDRSGTYFWKKKRNLLAIATRNLSINIGLSKRTTLIVALSLSFLMILSSLPDSLVNYRQDNAYYLEGCDWAVYSPNVAQNQNYTSQLKTIPGMNVTYVGLKNGLKMKYRGIEEDFFQTAHWQDYYDDSSLEELVFSLINSSAEFPVIVSSNFAKQRKLAVGDQFIGLEETECTIEGISNNWPGTSRGGKNVYFVITTLPALEKMTPYVDYYIWLKFLQGHNQTSLISQARTIIGPEPSEPSPVREVLGEISTNNPATAFIWVVTNINFIASLLVVTSTIVLFSSARIISDAPEIGLSRALGMKRKNLFVLLLLEPLFLLLISGIPGAIIGILLLVSSVLLSAPFLIRGPPFMLQINYPVIIAIFSFILIITSIIAVISSLVATRVNISSILQAE